MENIKRKRNPKSYLEITKILDIIKVLDILFLAKIPQDIHITISTFISCENIVIGYDDNLLTVPNLLHCITW